MEETDEYDELKEKFEQLCESNELLMNENALLQQALAKIPPDQLKAKPAAQRQRFGRGREKEKILTFQQKLTIANAEIERFQREITDRKKEVEELIESAKASMDVFQAELSDIQRESFEFHKNVVVEGVNEETHRAISEKVLQYFDSIYKEKCTLLSALQLKYTQMRQKQKRATQFEAQNKESGESLEEIDYEQLKIENQLFQEKINQRNKELLTFKLTAVSTQQTLNKKKRDLSQELKDKEWLIKEIEARRSALTKIDEELRKAGRQRDHALNLNKILNARHQEGERPRVLDYIKQKVLTAEVEKAVSMWERKVEIAEKTSAAQKKRQAALGQPTNVPISQGKGSQGSARVGSQHSKANSNQTGGNPTKGQLVKGISGTG